MSRSYPKRGFTVLELVAVIAIIALLLGLLLGPVSRAFARAKKLDREIGEGQASIVEMQEPGGLLSAE